MGVPEPEQMKVSVQMGVSEYIIRMNQRLGKVVCGGSVHLDNSVSSGPY